ncbi:hypothetical protein VNO77_42244 [Canavalia gladiata]|uniref:Uncharacterized protein n=1 Tax=Canavalia gladiata TaxID=3824 RepID=A0AAN9K0A8_CANGL
MDDSYFGLSKCRGPFLNYTLLYNVMYSNLCNILPPLLLFDWSHMSNWVLYLSTRGATITHNALIGEGCIHLHSPMIGV